MNPIKIGIISLIIIAGLAGSYLIIKNSGTMDTGNYVTIESGGKIAESVKNSPIQWVEKTLKKFSDADFAVAEKTDLKEIDSGNSSLNLTDLVAKSVSGQIQYLSQGGKDFNPNDPKNQEMIKKAIADMQSPPLFEGIIVENKNLKISNDNSKKAKQEYFEAIGKISQKNFSGFNKTHIEALSELVERNNAYFVIQLADIYKNTVNDYLNLTVPSDLVSIDKKMIVHFKTAQKIYEDIANFNIDPVRAQMSFQMIDKLIINAKTNQGLLENEYQKIQ